MYLLIAWGTINLFLSFLAFHKVKIKKGECEPIWWWAIPTGAFVWEDLFVFGFFHSSIAFIGVYTGSLNFWILAYVVFWIVRSAGETLYFFLQQFLVPQHHPHEMEVYFKPLKAIFGNISTQKSFILLQVFWQTVLVSSIVILILLLTWS